MKNIVMLSLLIVATCVNTYGQDTSKFKSKKFPPVVKHYGPYIVTVDNYKIVSVKKDPNFDYSKAIYRDTSSRRFPVTSEIYTANATTPIICHNFIGTENSTSSSSMLSSDERMKKYNSWAAVDIIHLKPGVVLLNKAELFNKFNISHKNSNLPLYINYKPALNPDELLTVSDAVLKIDVRKDGDGFKFLNIITKERDARIKKEAGQNLTHIK